MRLEVILSNSLTAEVGAIQSAKIYCFWFKFRCKCTTVPLVYSGTLIKDWNGSKTAHDVAVLGNILVGEGVVKNAFDSFNNNRDLEGGVNEFLRFSVEFYPIPFVQFRPSYTYYSNGPLDGEDDFFLQFHIGY